MGLSSRTKGVQGEQAVARFLRESGFHVESLQRNEYGNADLIINDRFYADSKRAETWKIHDWKDTAVTQTPPGGIPLLIMRRSREPWWVMFPLADFADVAR